jgi:hypothetical protein
MTAKHKAGEQGIFDCGALLAALAIGVVTVTAFLRKTGILFLLSILPLILMISWLFRVRITNIYKENRCPAEALLIP